MADLATFLDSLSDNIFEQLHHLMKQYGNHFYTAMDVVAYYRSKEG